MVFAVKGDLRRVTIAASGRIGEFAPQTSSLDCRSGCAVGIGDHFFATVSLNVVPGESGG